MIKSKRDKFLSCWLQLHICPFIFKTDCGEFISNCTNCAADLVKGQILCSQCDEGFFPSPTNRSCNGR